MIKWSKKDVIKAFDEVMSPQSQPNIIASLLDRARGMRIPTRVPKQPKGPKV